MHVEECGNPNGLPVIYLHGGPGSGCKAFHRRFFNPDRYRIVLLDQRGSGRSLPRGELKDNTTQDLLADLEFIRDKLKIDRWLVYGGSWGASLGLLYAQAYPHCCSGMLLRGSFLARQRDIDWFVGDGVRRIYPERWTDFLGGLPSTDGAELISLLHNYITGNDELAQRRIAKAWASWSEQIAQGAAFDPADFDKHADAFLLQKVRIELHYAKNGYFIKENQILDQCAGLPEMPTIIIHGRQDLVCPAESAYSLQQALPWAEMRILPTAGHLPVGDEMIDALVSATDAMADKLAV